MLDHLHSEAVSLLRRISAEGRVKIKDAPDLAEELTKLGLIKVKRGSATLIRKGRLAMQAKGGPNE